MPKIAEEIRPSQSYVKRTGGSILPSVLRGAGFDGIFFTGAVEATILGRWNTPALPAGFVHASDPARDNPLALESEQSLCYLYFISPV